MNNLGRIYQSDNFEFQEFVGEKIEALLGIVMQNDSDNHPLVINLKTTNKSWQRYFLDAWVCFWEDWGELVDNADDNDRFVDYGKMFELEGKVITSIKCVNCRVIIEIEKRNQFTLQLIDTVKDDTESEIKFIKK